MLYHHEDRYNILVNISAQVVTELKLNNSV
jgi:hypothetical protein